MHRFVLAACLAVLAACLADPGEEPGDGIDDRFHEVGGKADGGLSDAEIAGVLDLVNAASFDELDLDVPLDIRAARNLVAHRDGADAVPGTADDDPFDTLAELDEVPWVGPVALERLLAYAYANGYVDPTDPTEPPGEDCLVISEYIEGWGAYNKMIELYNCGDAPLALADYAICLVRNDDTACTLYDDLGTATLAPGAVTIACRRMEAHPASLDPIPQLAALCELERPGVMTFNGDDRLMLLDRDGAVVDSLGRHGYRPPQSTWADVVLRRCDLTAADGVSFYDHRDYFTEHPRGDIADFGAPPTPGGCP